MFTSCVCVVCVFVFHFLQNSSSLFILCECVCVCFFGALFSLFASFSPIYVYFLVCLLAYTIIQRKSETVDFNDFTFCKFYLLACVFFLVLLINDALFTTIATDLEFLQYDLCPVLLFLFFFVLNFDESNDRTWARHVFVFC